MAEWSAPNHLYEREGAIWLPGPVVRTLSTFLSTREQTFTAAQLAASVTAPHRPAAFAIVAFTSKSQF
jgi:hypothetical protein